MPHDKKGRPVAAGDKVVLVCEVVDVSPGAEYCNATLETVEKMFPGDHKTTVTINTKQCHVLQTDEVQILKHDTNPQVTGAVQKVGLSFDSIHDYAAQALTLLQKHGNDGLLLVDLGFRAFLAFRSRDFPTLFAALNDGQKTAATLITAIRDQFAL